MSPSGEGNGQTACDDLETGSPLLVGGSGERTGGIKPMVETFSRVQEEGFERE